MLCLQNFTTEEILNNHRERCLLINDTEAVKYELEKLNLNLKILINKYLYHLKFMPIQNVY